MCKEIQLPAETFGVEFVRKLLCLCNIADLKKRVVVHPVRNAVFVKDVFHHLPPVDIDLDEEGEPSLQLDMHKTEMLVQIIKVKVLALAVYGIKRKQPVIMFPGLERLAILHDRKDTDKAFPDRIVLKDL